MWNDQGSPETFTRFTTIRRRLEALEFETPLKQFTFEFVLFGFKQGWACLFGGRLLALILAPHQLYPKDAALARYDFLFLAALAIQAALLALRLETWREAKVILMFHMAGTAMKVFKTRTGSWIYPEPAVFRIADVPLLSGFMYAAVGSYIARVTRIFDTRYSDYPSIWATIALAIAIYVNFFAHHFVMDIPIALLAATLIFLAHAGVFHPASQATPDAASGRLPSGRFVYLVGRQHRDICPRLGLSAPEPELDASQSGQAWGLVSVDDHQLCARQPRASAEAARPARRWPHRSDSATRLIVKERQNGR